MFTTILVQPLFNILFALYAIIPGRDFGVAVILLTLLVRACLWPLVTRQLHSQRVLQQLQPEVARIRKEAAGDRQKESQLLMELYKERGTNPFASILPLLIQLPIFFALYIVLRDSVHVSEISKLTYGFTQHLGPIDAIIHHGASFSPKLFHLVDLTKPNAILAVLAGLGQYVQTRQLQPHTAPSPGDQQAQMMRTMTYIFPVITAVIGLRLPSALALYWMVTSFAATFQQYWVLHRDAEELEEVADASGITPTVSSEGDDVYETTTGPVTNSRPKPKTRRKKKRSRA